MVGDEKERKKEEKKEEPRQRRGDQAVLWGTVRPGRVNLPAVCAPKRAARPRSQSASPVAGVSGASGRSQSGPVPLAGLPGSGIIACRRSAPPAAGVTHGPSGSLIG